MQQFEIATQRPVIDDKAIVNTDSSGTIAVLNPVSGRVFVINDVARRILELSDGTNTVDDIVASILAEFKGSERDSTQRDVQDFLIGCTEAQIVHWDGSES